VVHDWSATTSTPQRHTDDRRYNSCFRVVIRPRPRNTYRRRSGDADACSENCVALLRRPPSAASNSSLSATACFPVAGVTLVNSRLDYGNGALICLPVYLTRRLQSVLNAAARLIFNLRRSHHVSDTLISLHQLRVPERIRSKVSVLVYKVLHGSAPSYLGPCTYVADLPSRRGLRSSCSACLVQPPVHRSTVGSRAFSVAGPRVWNCLPPEVTSAPPRTTFRTRLKTFLFTESYPDIRLI